MQDERLRHIDRETTDAAHAAPDVHARLQAAPLTHFALIALLATAGFLTACRYEPLKDSANTANANTTRTHANANASTTPTPAASSDNTNAQGDLSDFPTGRLLIPVAGVRPEDLHDTYAESRSQEREHNAIDIAAPRGTPVIAASDGRIIKLFTSAAGGLTIYQLMPDNRTILYYAHLERYADGLSEGHAAHRGEVIGYVGDTGNAGTGNYHLHFSVSITDDSKKWWSGENINPYPLLRGQR